MENNIYYVYVYLDPRKPGDYNYGEYHFDYEPIYIGKGKDDRIDAHLFESQQKHTNNIKLRKLKKIKELELEPIRYKLYENLEEQDAWNIEEQIIDLIGRIVTNTGPLSNIESGGKGEDTITNHPDYENICRKNSENLKKFYQTEEGIKAREEISKRKTGIHPSEETRKKHGDSIRGEKNHFYNKHHTEESLKLIKERTPIRRGEEHPNFGKKQPESQIAKQYIKVYQYDLEMNFIKEYKSIKYAAECTGARSSKISCCCSCKSKTAGGFIWKKELIIFETAEDRLKEAEKHSPIHTGGKRVYTEEERKEASDRIRGEKNPNYKRVYTEEERKANSERQTGEKHWHYGGTNSEETRKKQSESQKGKKNHQWNRVWTEEERQDMSVAVKEGKRKKKEEREKLNNINRNYNE